MNSLQTSPDELLRSCVNIEMFEAYRDYALKDELTQSRDGHQFEVAFKFALIDFFDRLPETGVMKRFDYLKDPDSSLPLRVWNTVVNKILPTGPHTRNDSNKLADTFADVLKWRISVNHTKDQQSVSYDEMIDYVANGALDRLMPANDSRPSRDLSKHHFIQDWGIVPGGMFQKDKDTVQHANINFPTGRVIYADMIRLKPILNLYQQYATEDISSAVKNKANLTAKFAQHNILHTFAGETYPQVFATQSKSDDTIIIVGNQDEDTSSNLGEFTDTGKFISTEMKTVTMVDESVLIELLSATMDEKSAKREIQKLLKDDGANLMEINPGEYLFYYHGDPHRVHDNFEPSKNQDTSKNVSVDFGSLDYQFVLSKLPIVFNPKLERKSPALVPDVNKVMEWRAKRLPAVSQENTSIGMKL